MKKTSLLMGAVLFGICGHIIGQESIRVQAEEEKAKLLQENNQNFAGTVEVTEGSLVEPSLILEENFQETHNQETNSPQTSIQEAGVSGTDDVSDYHEDRMPSALEDEILGESEANQDELGILSQENPIVNTWKYSEEEDKWSYYNESGIISSIVEKQGYWIGDQQVFDTIVEIQPGKYYYYEGQDKGGVRSHNTWSYSPGTQSWHKTAIDGLVLETFNKQGYWVDGKVNTDKVIKIQDTGDYFITQAGVLAAQGWHHSKENESWYYTLANGKIEARLNKNEYTVLGEKLSDVVILIDEVGYFYVDQEGRMATNGWNYSKSEDKWHYSDQYGVVVSTMAPKGYWINGRQLFDTVVEIQPGKYYYYEGQDKGGVRSHNTWSYSPGTQSWHKSGNDGFLLETFNKQGYWVDGKVNTDKVIKIQDTGDYFITQAGILAAQGWHHSKETESWYYTLANGKIEARLNKNEYTVFGEKLSDVVILIDEVGYFYVDQEGRMATNGWNYSKSEDKWHYSNQYGVIVSTVAPQGYWINGRQLFDTIVETQPGKYYYYEGQDKGGVRSHNTWSYSPGTQSWHKTAADGLVLETFNKQGYWIGGVAQYDTVLEHKGIKYFFERNADGGKMSVNKWSKSDKANLWYQSDVNGRLIKKDKVGPVLPNRVKLDNGQWRMFTLAQDNWGSGCWLRTAAAGINSAGGNMTPQTLIKDIKQTNDPRTGMLSQPWIVNNWSLGGAYSATWPEALTPVVQKYVPNAANISGASFNDIKRELANGNTVQVYYAWATPNIRLNGAAGRGSFMASRDYHSVLLTGYNETGFYYQEHWGNPRNNHFSFSKLQWQYNAYGQKAISYRKDNYQP